MRKEIGQYLIDISKLVFGGVVLGTIFNIGDIPKSTLLLLGVLATLIFAIWGFLLIKDK
ncbi:MAG: ABC transporter permease [Cytophagales bacterium]|nr:ABC transporter permease [Cytophagales bacterium]